MIPVRGRSGSRPGDAYGAIVVGSGAGGGIVAARLAELGHRVLLIERGGYHTAADFSRWELRANAQLWNPPVLARTNGAGPIAMVSGRGVGGSTNINTKVGIRAQPQDYRKWFAASGLLGANGQPFDARDLDPWFARVEERMLVRERSDWTESVRVVEKGFRENGATLTPVTSYTSTDCISCGSCTAGCHNDSGSTTLNRYIHQAFLSGSLDVAPDTEVLEVLTSVGGTGRREATGVRLRDREGERVVESPVVVVAGGALHSPHLLQLSGLDRLGTTASAMIGTTLGTHTARMVQGDFEQLMDAHIVYPITAHCEEFADDEAGGFVVEATTLLDPMALAHNLVDDDGLPLWGQPLVEAMRRYRHLAGLFMMTNDSNLGRVSTLGDGSMDVEVHIPPEDQKRLDEAYDFCRRVLFSAGARGIVPTGYLTSHIQGSVRMGSDPQRSACDANQQLWDVDGLYVGDSSVLPRTLTYNPSLTIMALAERLASHLDAAEGRLDQAA